MRKKLFGQLQRIGKALMLPVAILPAAGLLLAFGAALQGEQLQSYLPFIQADGVQNVAEMMAAAGSIIFENLPIIFAMGVAIGLAGGDGVAAIAAFVGFIILNKTMGEFLGVTPDNVGDAAKGYASVLGIPTLQTGCSGVSLSVLSRHGVTTSFITFRYRHILASLQENDLYQL